MNSTSPCGIAVRDEDGIRTITFNRPDKKNAITEAMWRDLGDAFATAAWAGNSVVVVTGAGDSFSAGNDLMDFIEHPPQDEDASVFRCLLALANLELPLIAAVRGSAVGVGTTLLLHCDLVFAAPNARFKVPFVDLGVVPENASSILMPQRMGRARAGAYLLLGETVNVEQALADGLITRIVPDEELEATAMKAAKIIAAKPRQAMLEATKLLRHDRPDIVDAIRREGKVFCERLKSDEARQVMAAFFKR